MNFYLFWWRYSFNIHILTSSLLNWHNFMFNFNSIFFHKNLSNNFSFFNWLRCLNNCINFLFMRIGNNILNILLFCYFCLCYCFNCFNCFCCFCCFWGNCQRFLYWDLWGWLRNWARDGLFDGVGWDKSGLQTFHLRFRFRDNVLFTFFSLLVTNSNTSTHILLWNNFRGFCLFWLDFLLLWLRILLMCFQGFDCFGCLFNVLSGFNFLYCFYCLSFFNRLRFYFLSDRKWVCTSILLKLSNLNFLLSFHFILFLIRRFWLWLFLLRTFPFSLFWNLLIVNLFLRLIWIQNPHNFPIFILIHINTINGPITRLFAIIDQLTTFLLYM